MKIKINNKSYEVKLGYKAFRILSETWEIPTLKGVSDKLNKVLLKKNEISFSEMDLIGDLFLAGILSENPDAEITRDDILEHSMDNPGVLKQILQDYSKSQAVGQGKPNPQKRGGSK